jgi:hypothetical protein
MARRIGSASCWSPKVFEDEKAAVDDRERLEAPRRPSPST